ncbi:hypothetical protein [Embleya sp. NPDC005575]|uniref:hypothetical protein n=1 Tax=Embleya sp. NPDC005575 TaxID=3156892 RepID=UPI0033A71A43
MLEEDQVPEWDAWSGELREFMDFHAARVADMRTSRDRLLAEVAALDERLVQAEASLRHLNDMLAEFKAGSRTPDPPEPDHHPTTCDDEEPRGPGPASRGVPAERRNGRPTGTGLKSGQLAQAVLRVLATSGRPMRAREITEALGRPTHRKKVETTRVTAKRLATQGKLVEVEPGLFRMANPLRGGGVK